MRKHVGEKYLAYILKHLKALYSGRFPIAGLVMTDAGPCYPQLRRIREHQRLFGLLILTQFSERCIFKHVMTKGVPDLQIFLTNKFLGAEFVVSHLRPVH